MVVLENLCLFARSPSQNKVYCVRGRYWRVLTGNANVVSSGFLFIVDDVEDLHPFFRGETMIAGDNGCQFCPDSVLVVMLKK